MSDRRKRCRGPWNLWKGTDAGVQVGLPIAGHDASSPAWHLVLRTERCWGQSDSCEAGVKRWGERAQVRAISVG